MRYTIEDYSPFAEALEVVIKRSKLKAPRPTIIMSDFESARNEALDRSFVTSMIGSRVLDEAGTEVFAALDGHSVS